MILQHKLYSNGHLANGLRIENMQNPVVAVHQCQMERMLEWSVTMRNS